MLINSLPSTRQSAVWLSLKSVLRSYQPMITSNRRKKKIENETSKKKFYWQIISWSTRSIAQVRSQADWNIEWTCWHQLTNRKRMETFKLIEKKSLITIQSKTFYLPRSRDGKTRGRTIEVRKKCGKWGKIYCCLQHHLMSTDLKKRCQWSPTSNKSITPTHVSCEQRYS